MELFTLGKKFAEICQKYVERVALQVYESDGNLRPLTYRQLWEEAVKVSGWLTSQNIKKQDRVAIILENSPHWAAVYFGIMLCGAVAVPLDPQMSKETIFTLLEDSEAKIVFINGKLKSVFNIICDGLSSLKRIVLIQSDANPDHIAPGEEKYLDFSAIINWEVKEVSFPAIELDEAASILYTSGTTAVAKGVELTHRNFSANFLSIQDLNLFSAEEFDEIFNGSQAYSIRKKIKEGSCHCLCTGDTFPSLIVRSFPLFTQG